MAATLIMEEYVMTKQIKESLKNLFFMVLCVFIFVSCTKVIAYGTTVDTAPLTKTYSTSTMFLTQKTREALKTLGYELTTDGEYDGHITTGWRPALSDSHYLELFKRRDYGASAGAYYQIVADIQAEGDRAKLTVATKTKSIAGKLKSSFRMEKQLLKQVDDYLRSPQITITNVGVEEK